MKTNLSEDAGRSGLPHHAQARFTLFLLILVNLAALSLVCFIAIQTMRRPLEFDDAFMFHRYAVHLREGMGISWNPDRIHTGGMTSMGWFLVVLPLSFLPLGQGQSLAMGSFAVGIAGIVILALHIARLSSSSLLKRFWLVFPSLLLLLLGVSLFRRNMLTGMDTMLSFALDAALSCSIWAWCNATGNSSRNAVLVGLLGAAAVIARPENGLFAVIAPLLAACFLLDNRRRKQVLWSALTFGAIMAIYLVFYRAYFHAWLPLSFYMKSQHPYRGYIGATRWLPEFYLGNFLLLALPILAFPLMCLNRRSLRIAVTYLVPLALTFAYLETVTQIMGTDARYYVPFIAPVLVAAFWMADVSFPGVSKDWRHLLRPRLLKIACSGLLLLFVGMVIWPRVEDWSRHRLFVAPYARPALLMAARSPLPERPWFTNISLLANQVIKPLPAGSVVAASEVGLIGAAAPQVAVIDLAGLNDNDIALHGFSMDRLLARKPLLIWFPHSDYTWQRQAMFCSPGLLQQYTVLGGDAFNYSLAIRRDTPETPELMQRVARTFQQLYPGVAMKDYIVSSISCTQ
jgi:hypothetical protein